MSLRILVLLQVAALLLSISSVAYAARPNIVIILADDLGWGDPQCYNQDSKIPTPAMNRLADEGIRFTDAHTPSAVCTPTRYGLLTGRYCWRSRLKSSVLDGFSPPLIEPERTTIASFLKQQGYATACIGKWHLGMQWTREDGSLEDVDRAPKGFRPGDNIDFTKPITGGPLAVGFDHYFGISASLDMPPYCWINGDRCQPVPTSSVATAKNTIFLNQTGGVAHSDFELHDVLPRLKEHATKWMRDHHASDPDQPFFLYLPLNSPHLPVAPSKPFLGKSQAGLYGDFVVETDDCVGAVLNTLDEIDEADSTLVLFTSDNGGLWHRWNSVESDDVQHYRPTPRANYTHEFDHQSNAHLRGTKADIWEGGHRVPFLVRWPEAIQAGQVCDQLVELNDVMATLADVVDKQLPEGAGEDSRSFRSLLEGASQPTRTLAIHHSLRGEFAIRSGDWKLMRSRGSGGFSTPRKMNPPRSSPRGQLYNLKEDLSETKNVWNENSKVVRKLLIELGDIVEPMNRQRVQFTSSADGTQQEAFVILPPKYNPNLPTPIVVSLHSWSADLTQRNLLERAVHDRGWIYLFPNFRGVNQTPEACGSRLAQQDIVDAVDWACREYNVDQQRIYLTGTSGGGHMTMMMSARYPKRWRAASAWVGISHLATWYGKHKGSKYGNMLEEVCGGSPGDSPEIDRQYSIRSPAVYLSNAREVALDISAGIQDGHAGSVPIRHSIDAFNVIARANGTKAVSETEIESLSTPTGRLAKPNDGDEGFDESFGRDFYLRRRSKAARLTIFEGGHEGIAEATVAWV